MRGSTPIRDLASLAEHLKGYAFGLDPAGAAGADRRRIGAEAELLVWELDSGAVASVERTTTVLRAHGAPLGWVEGRTRKGHVSFALPAGGAVTFEPGGQLEYASPPLPTASALLDHLAAVLEPLRLGAEEAGLELLALGLDPLHPPEAAPLQLGGPRYGAMAEYFAALGPAGARMMRQTAAFQVSLDGGAAPFLRWTLLNRLAPVLVAMFANSPLYAGRPTGDASHRAATWRALDSSRTGIFVDPAAPVASYLEFALCAPWMLRRTEIDARGRWLPFCGWLARGEGTLEEWEEHLSTLFPEVRPHGRLEVRSMDAIDPEWYAAPVALLVGLAYDRATLAQATELLWAVDPELLQRAGARGLADPTLARLATDLCDLALAGCARLGPAYIAPHHLAVAGEFFDRYTRRGRAPGDDTGGQGRAMAVEGGYGGP
ncbi:MAG TPA: glutamate-cysteine ligase family protein [Gemmatimonadales bacterium]|nr:glutamate-cysteine ligase family protein [Gemmatimonadales bacterium]